MDNAQLAELQEEISTLWKELKNKNLSLKDFNDLAVQIRNCYINILGININTLDKDCKEYRDLKKRFFNEVEALRRVVLHLQEKGEAPKNINFCAHNQEYDGIFDWESHQICLEITRAADENYGQNEQLVRELLEKRGMAPYAQQIDAEGNKYNRVFRLNEPIARRIDISEFSEPLKKAFDHKNKEKYKIEGKDSWLIITLPLHRMQDLNFYKSCLEFWDAINQNCDVFKRIFVVSEEGIRSDLFDRSPIWDSANNDLYKRYAYE